MTDVDAAYYNSSHGTMNNNPHTTNAATSPEAENNTPVRQLLDGQEYPFATGDIIKKGFDREATVEQWVAYTHSFSELHGYPWYNGDIIKLYTCLQILPIDNNAMLVAAKFMVDFRGMHFNEKRVLYIIFRSMLHFFVGQC